MKKIYTLSVGFFLFMIHPAFSFAGGPLAHSIQGKVTDAATGLPLVGATVLLEPLQGGCVTGERGEYVFGILPKGNYRVLVKYLGYQTDTLEVQVREGEQVTLQSHLVSADIQLAQTEIVAGRDNDHSLLSSIDIRLRPVLSSQEVLRQVPGLLIAQHAGGGKAEQIFLRGYDIDHGTDIAISVDGVPANMVSHAHGQGYTDLHFLIPELITSINFGKGPYDADRGNFTTAGFVDLGTARDIVGSSLKTEIGNFNTVRSVMLLDLMAPSADRQSRGAYLAVEQLYSNGYFDRPQHLHRQNVMGKYHLALGRQHELEATFTHFTSNWSASTQVPVRAVEALQLDRFGTVDNREGGETSRTGLNLELRSFGPQNGLWKNQVYLHRYDFDLRSNFTYFMRDTAFGDLISQREDRWVMGYQGSHTRSLPLLGRDLTLRAGAGGRLDLPRDISLADVGAGSTVHTQRGNVRETNLGGFTQADWQLTTRLTLGGGLRADQFCFQYQDLMPEHLGITRTAQQAILSPKAHLDYMPNEKVKLYLKAGSGFHSNDTRVITDSVASQALPRVVGCDVGTFLKPIDGLLLNIAAWAMQSQSEFVYVGDEGIVEQSGRSRRLGMDFSARWQLRKWLFADIDVSLARPRLLDLPTGENHIPLAPVLSSTGGLTFLPASNLRGALRYRYVADRPANEDYTFTAEGYFLLDANLTLSLGHVDLNLTASNLLNTQWKEAQFVTTSRLRSETAPVTDLNFTPGSPFSLRGGIAVHFN
jgi:outer membrane receptor protein involved in Fe transport